MSERRFPARRCEWNFKYHRPATDPGSDGDCENEATLCLGKRITWHLCGACSKDPAFARIRRRQALPPLPARFS